MTKEFTINLRKEFLYSPCSILYGKSKPKKTYLKIFVRALCLISVTHSMDRNRNFQDYYHQRYCDQVLRRFSFY